MNHHTHPEILETRIAPANFLVSPVTLGVTDATTGAFAMDTVQETNAASQTAADFAVLLQAGDKLVWDKNFNGKLDKTDPVMVTVTEGRAMVFLNDLDDDGGFDLPEISGVATGGNFSGAINTDVQGSVLAALDANGALLAAKGVVFLSDTGSITKLDVKGAITDKLAAGLGISNVKIGKPIAGGTTVSVNGILTGDTDSNALLGAVEFSLDSLAPTGGPIDMVTLSAGAREISVGTAGGSSVGSAISNITILEQSGDLAISSGGGATSRSAGAISNITITNKTAIAGSISIQGGTGGNDAGMGAGGSGGPVSNVTIKIPEILGEVSIEGGEAGSGFGNNGGAGFGGDVTGVTINAKLISGGVSIYGGAGGASGMNSGGPDGGDVNNVNLATTHLHGNFYVSGGDGGQGSIGGRGGLVMNVTGKATGIMQGLISVSGGMGGQGLNGTGSEGGDVSFITMMMGTHLGSFEVYGGDANIGTTAGADGGSTADVNYTAKKTLNGGFFASGGGGSIGVGGNGGSGGDLSRVTFSTPLLAGNIRVTGGNGAQGTAGGGDGGALGVVNVTLGTSLLPAKGSHFISSGDGGVANVGFPNGTFAGGAGGQLNDVTFKAADLAVPLTISSGDGNTGANGGNAGALLRAKVTVTGHAAEDVVIEGGNGGFADDSTGGQGGAGGTNTDSSITVGTAFGYLRIAGGFGGGSEDLGGAAGAVVDGTITGGTVVGSSAGAFIIGGDGGSGQKGAVGGDVTNGKIKLAAGHGGLVGGLGGNGSAAPGGGGNVLDSNVTITRLLGNVSVGGGPANGLGGSGAAGVGGSVVNADISIKTGSGNVYVQGGYGALNNSAVGSAGGRIEDVNIVLGPGLALGRLEVTSGYGGGGASNSPGGAGGAIDGLIVNSSATIERLIVTTGNGGNSTNGLAGSGGDLIDSSFTILGAITESAVFTLGNGGTASNATGADGGSFTNVVTTFGKPVRPGINVSFTAGNGGAATVPTFQGIGGMGGGFDGFTLTDRGGANYVLRAGRGGDSGADGPDIGGAGGSVNNVTLTAALADVRIGDPLNSNFGRGGNAYTGGAGGDVSNVKGTVGKLIVLAGNGGALTGGTNRVGGAGGDITGVNVKATSFVQQLRAGSGGGPGVGTGNVGGVGGSIMDSTITGDIGNHFGFFGTGTAQMGGLIAGLGGAGESSTALNGSISGIKAGRIAAMFAGGINTTGDLSAANAVQSIANITAKSIAADLDKDGALDFIDAGPPGFDLDGLDVLIDGVVIVRNNLYDAATVKPTVPAPFLLLV